MIPSPRMAQPRRFLVSGTVAAALLIGAQPVFAETELSHTGTWGTHDLTDSTSYPGATCSYLYKSASTDGKLIKIVVRPPHMQAVAGKNAQTVGWKFSVQRRVQGIGGATDWVRRYLSPEMTAVTDDAHYAAFDSASVPVITGPAGAGGMYQYRVVVGMIWHRQDGSIQGRVRSRIDSYRNVLDTGPARVTSNYCDAWWMFPD